MENLDEESAGKFINALIKSVQTLCHGYLNFHDGVEIIGNINLSVDRGSRLHYILEEKVCKNEENSTLFISNSFFAQNLKSDPKTKAKDSQCTPSGNQVVQRLDSTDSEGGTVSSALSSITTALTVSQEKSRSGSSSNAKDSDTSHSKPNTAKRKASEDHSDVRTAKSSHLSSSPSPVSNFLTGSPHSQSGPSSPTDTKPRLGRFHSDTRTESDGGDGDLNLAGSVLERVDDHSNSDLPDRTEDSDGDLEVTFIKEEYVEGEQSSCQYENSGGQYSRGARQRGTSESLSDPSLYPVSLHHNAPATFVPGAHDVSAQHYGPSTSSQPQPGTSGARGGTKPTSDTDPDAEELMHDLSSLCGQGSLVSPHDHSLHQSQRPNHQQPPDNTGQVGTPKSQIGMPQSQSGMSQSQLGMPQSQSGTPQSQLGTPQSQPGTPQSQSGTFTCQYCGHSYKAYNSLGRHIRQVHFNRPAYRCELCAQGFAHKDHYTAHMNKHYNTPTFQCEHCNQKFMHKTGLNKHRKTCSE